MPWRALALISAILVWAPRAAPAAAIPESALSDVMPFNAAERTLANGLKVIVVPTGFPNLVSLQIPVQTGSRNEVEPGKSGFAHLFEHLMFRGTKANPAEKYQAIMTKVGARQNAYTTDDYTNYHATFAKEDLSTVLALEADRFMNLAFDEATFKTETRAVLGEYDKNSADPWNKLEEALRDTAFTVHPYKHTTMGFLKDIEDMPNQYAYAKTFFERWYRPELTTVIVAGDVQAEQVFPLVEKYFGAWKQGTGSVVIPSEPAGKGPFYTHVPWPTATLPWVVVAFHGPAFSASEPRHAAVSLCLDLYAGETSDLYKRLVEHEQKVDKLVVDVPDTQDPGLVLVAARLKNIGDAAEVRDSILKTLAQARSELLTAQRVQGAKSNARFGFVGHLDSTQAIAGTLARTVRFERRFGTVNQYYRTLATVTPEQIRDVARSVFIDENMVIATLSHETMPAAIGRPAKIKSLEVVRTEHGTVDLLMRPSALPILDMKLTFAVGSAHDPKGKEGLAALAAAMVTEAGSRQSRTDEVRAALYPLAASFSAQVDKEVTTLTGAAHADVWSAFADVVFPMIITPGLRNEDFTRLRDAQLAALTQDLRTNNDEELGKEELQALVLRGTPYAHPVVGTVAGIKAITLEDVKQFIARHYTRANLVVGLAGNAGENVLELVRSELSKLPGGEHTPTPTVSVPAVKGLSVDIIAKDTRATAISLGHPLDVIRGQADFAALYLARTWLGEHRSSMSHLFQRIREARGLNYGDYAYVEAFPNGMFQLFPSPNRPRRHQLFEIWLRPVQPKNAHMALRIALYELQKLVDEGLTQEQLDTTRTYLLKNVFVMTARQDQELGYALDSRWFGIPDFTQYMRDALQSLTLQQVNDAIKAHLHPKDLKVVMVTKDGNALKSALIKDGPSPIAYEAPKPEELLAEDAKISAVKLGLSASAVNVTPVDQVFAR